MSRFYLTLSSLSNTARTQVPTHYTRQTAAIQFGRSQRHIHLSQPQHAIMMPAMSPLVSEGTITQWKKKEGEAFSVGDVLLQIESDIATIDVEAQSAGILTKILMPDGTQNIPVEQAIALVTKDADEFANFQSLSQTRPTQTQPPITNHTGTTSHLRTPEPTPRRFPSPLPQLTSRAGLESSKAPLLRSPSLRENDNSIFQRSSAMRGMVTNTVPNRTVESDVSKGWHTKEYDFGGRVGIRGDQELQNDGVALRRMIVSNLSHNPSQTSASGSGNTTLRPNATSPAPVNKTSSTNEYFDGLI